MARPIQAIPTLSGSEAIRFERAAKCTEANPGTIDYRHQARVVAAYLQKSNVL